MALDTLLFKEHGICGCLKDRIDHCCIHIPNVTQDVEHELDLLENIKENIHEFQQNM